MKMNVGSRERYMRLGLGVAALAAIPFVHSRFARMLLGTVAGSGLSTGLARYCPINQALGRGFGVDEASVHALKRKFSGAQASAESMLH